MFVQADTILSDMIKKIHITAMYMQTLNDFEGVTFNLCMPHISHQIVQSFANKIVALRGKISLNYSSDSILVISDTLADLSVILKYQSKIMPKTDSRISNILNSGCTEDVQLLNILQRKSIKCITVTVFHHIIKKMLVYEIEWHISRGLPNSYLNAPNVFALTPLKKKCEGKPKCACSLHSMHKPIFNYYKGASFLLSESELVIILYRIYSH